MTKFVLSVKIVSDKSLKKFNNSFCLGVRFLCFVIPSFFISFNVFKSFLADISLTVILINQVSNVNILEFILCLSLNVVLSIVAKIFLNLFLSNQ